MRFQNLLPVFIALILLGSCDSTVVEPDVEPTPSPFVETELVPLDGDHQWVRDHFVGSVFVKRDTLQKFAGVAGAVLNPTTEVSGWGVPTGEAEVGYAPSDTALHVTTLVDYMTVRVDAFNYPRRDVDTYSYTASLRVSGREYITASYTYEGLASRMGYRCHLYTRHHEGGATTQSCFAEAVGLVHEAERNATGQMTSKLQLVRHTPPNLW